MKHLVVRNAGWCLTKAIESVDVMLTDADVEVDV